MRGVSVYRLSKLTGVAETTIYRIETGEAAPKTDTIWSLATQLDVDPKWLLYGGEVDPRERFFTHRDFGIWLKANPLVERSRGYEARVVGFDWGNTKHWPVGAIPGIEPETNNPTAIGTAGWQSFGVIFEEALDALQTRITSALDTAFAAGSRPRGFQSESDADGEDE